MNLTKSDKLTLTIVAIVIVSLLSILSLATRHECYKASMSMDYSIYMQCGIREYRGNEAMTGGVRL